MNPKLIPWNQVIILSLIFGIIITSSFIDGSRLATTVFNDNGKNTSLTTTENLNRDDDPNFEVDSVVSDSKISSFDLKSFLFNLLSFLMITIFSLLVFASSYVYAINSRSLKLYIDTSLKLAGFDSQMPKIGKSWTIDKSVFLSLNKKVITLTLPKFNDPRILGFRPTDQHAITSCDLNKIQLKLQLVRNYLDNYS